MSDAIRDLHASAWGHIDAKRFDQAEAILRELIGRIDPADVQRRWHCFGLLASVLNSLERVDEGTEMYRKALDEARRLPEPATEVGVSRYMLGNQYLLFGDARDALETVDPVPEGVGHLQRLLHAVAAEALWKLEQRDEARTRARVAVDASPNDERRAELSKQLAHILGTG